MLKSTMANKYRELRQGLIILFPSPVNSFMWRFYRSYGESKYFIVPPEPGIKNDWSKSNGACPDISMK